MGHGSLPEWFHNQFRSKYHEVPVPSACTKLASEVDMYHQELSQAKLSGPAEANALEGPKWAGLNLLSLLNIRNHSKICPSRSVTVCHAVFRQCHVFMWESCVLSRSVTVRHGSSRFVTVYHFAAEKPELGKGQYGYVSPRGNPESFYFSTTR